MIINNDKIIHKKVYDFLIILVLYTVWRSAPAINIKKNRDTVIFHTVPDLDSFIIHNIKFAVFTSGFTKS
jgi:hypothetical protein